MMIDICATNFEKMIVVIYVVLYLTHFFNTFGGTDANQLTIIEGYI